MDTEELKQLLHALWLIFPAYVANGSPVVGAKILRDAGFRLHPVDCGKNFVDGRRVFGDNKTWEGLAVGVLMGVVTGVLQKVAVGGGGVYVVRAVILSVGAMLGDLIGAFVKRRLGMKPGDPLPILDQLLFLFTAIPIAMFTGVLSLTTKQIIFLAAVTFVLHLSTNYIAYKLGLKEVPW